MARTTVDAIKAAVAAEFGVPLREMTSDRRHRGVARPRQVAMTLACALTPHSLPMIGRLFRRDHSTVLASRRRVEALRAADGDLDRRIRRLELALAAPTPTVEPVQFAFLDGPLFDQAFGQVAAS